MQRFDIAIHGFGLLPGLLALHLLQRVPMQDILLIWGDPTIGGAQLEPVLGSSLSPAARGLVEPFIVARWPGYFITRNSVTKRCDDDVLLLDPVQLWLELQALERPPAMELSGGTVASTGHRLDWAGGAAEALQFIELDQLTRRTQCSEILGLELARSLPLPVLADFDTHGEPWDAFQHIPLGDDRVYIRKRNCRGDAEMELTTGPGKLLSDLIGA